MEQYTTEEILAEVIETTNHSLWDKAIRLDKVRQADYSGIKKNLSINLDYAQIIPILCNIDTGYILDDVLYHYRVYESSVSHSCRIEHIFDTELVSEYVIQKLTDANLISPIFSKQSISKRSSASNPSIYTPLAASIPFILLLKAPALA